MGDLFFYLGENPHLKIPQEKIPQKLSCGERPQPVLEYVEESPHPVLELMDKSP